MNNLLNISPIDGRYSSKTNIFQNYFSEYALIKTRTEVEIRWLIFLLKEKIINKKLTNKQEKILLNIVDNFNINDAEQIKEKEMITKHDVKAVEYFLQDKLKKLNMEEYIPYIHITLTSEDINNTSYNLMIKRSIKEIYMPKVKELIEKLESLSTEYKEVSILGHTHGQIATPTTIGKELKVFAYRLKSILNMFEDIKLRSKFSGAVGCYNCHVVAFPKIDWISKTKEFIESLDLEYNPLTTQIESHDILCLLLSHIKIFNNIIKDLNSDLWLYISKGYFHEKKKDNEVGSSVMPHKVNPINQENSMANTEVSNSLIDCLVNNLSISRMQRDLSDSSKMRNLGVIFAHSYISITETITGLDKLQVNYDLIKEELDSHYEVLSEAIQTVLRKNGDLNAYEKLKYFSRGKKIEKKDLIEFVKELDINEQDKEILLNLTPENYIGLANKIVENN